MAAEWAKQKLKRRGGLNNLRRGHLKKVFGLNRKKISTQYRKLYQFRRFNIRDILIVIPKHQL